MITGWAKKIDTLVNENSEEMLRFLERLVNTDSYSRDREGVNRVGKIFEEKFLEMGYEVKTLPQKDLGDHILARNKTIPLNKKILLMGHRDTVFVPGTTKEFCFRLDGDTAYGPGVADMKGGLALMVYALWAIRQLGIDEPSIEVLITPDEEIGSPSSRKVIEEVAQNAVAVFNIESGRPDGSIVSGRKGAGHLELNVIGKASHAGIAIDKGISAIEDLARKIVKLHQLTDLDIGRTVNVGLVTGGTNTNTVAGRAEAKIHFGFNTLEDGKMLLEKIKEIILNPELAGTESMLSGGITFLPMEKTTGTARLVELIKDAGKMYGVSIYDTYTKGASDAGFTSVMGIPTVCGMGPVGGSWHTIREYMKIPTLAERCKILAMSVLLAAREWADWNYE